MTFLVLLLSHLAASGIGAAITQRVVVGNFTVREVEGETVMAISHKPGKRERPSGIAWAALVASLLVIVIGSQAWISVHTTLDRVNENTDNITAQQRRLDNEQRKDKARDCEDAYFWLFVLDREPDPNEPPPSKSDKEAADRLRADKQAAIKELNCPPPGGNTP